ncbi:UGSC family (seleno)protein [Tropicimonas isoalkanivorans]|uniref:UGSC-like domain-containing protein n=1 Tax=Tropicimonas isoalkanivorans TaxID=441112 RepID=A0A1I1I532_9RHOB|nr:hypothetical protein [Tropicimonas isoalkanivorans]SFC29308.1 hypothetical protein SAMN04488094_103340 [Tropicimonas isoalkanivorans]
MTKGYVLDPTGFRTDDNEDAGPPLPGLKGAVIGFRVDELWRSWDWVSEIWAEMLRQEGAEVRFWRAGGRTGPVGEKVIRELDEFTDELDAFVVGLANCGSCTSWTIHDALWGKKKGLPTVAVATRHFDELSQNLARRGGESALRRHILPYPLDIRQKAEVHDIAKDHYRPFLRTFGLRDRLAVEPAA